MDACIFCRIVAGEIPAQVVAQSTHALAFRDLSPQAPTHVLVIPKQHVAGWAHLGPEHAEAVGEMALLVKQVAEAEGLGEGYRVVCNQGPAAGQTVFHLHWHLLGGRSLSWPPG